MNILTVNDLNNISGGALCKIPNFDTFAKIIKNILFKLWC